MIQVIRMTFLLVLLLAGCRDTSDQTALIVVNGVPLTADEAREHVLLMARVRELAGRPVKGDFKTWANASAMQSVGPLVNMRLLGDEARHAGVEVSSQDCARVLAIYNQATGRKDATLATLAKEFGSLQAAFLKEVDEASRIKAYERTQLTPTISDEVIDQYMALNRHSQQQAREISSQAKAKAEKTYARLVAGEKWEKVAAECSEDRLVSPKNALFARIWLETDAGVDGMREISSALMGLKKGEFTRPIDMREGLVIVRVVDVKDGKYKLARILFRMGASLETVERDREKVRERLQTQGLLRRRDELLERLQRSAHIEYPLGTNFNYKIWK